MVITEHEPSPLELAIRDQQAVVNKLADDYSAAHANLTDLGDKLSKAHQQLSALIDKQRDEVPAGTVDG